MSEILERPGARGVLETLDESAVTRFQWKIMFISGMGFFTDAYDLFIIGVVVALLKPEWQLSTSQVSLLNSATLAASAVGALLFGRIADILGRKRIYGYEVLILAAGAIASAFSPNYVILLVSRIILGIGIGGDYPVSGHHHERVFGQALPRPDGRARVRDAGRRARRRAAHRVDPAGLGRAAHRNLADPARARRHPGNRRLLPAPPDPRDAAFRDGRWRLRCRQGSRCHRDGSDHDHRTRGGPGDPPAPVVARWLLRHREEPPDAAVADRHRRLLGAARLRLLRQYDFQPGDPQADQPARKPARQHPAPARHLRHLRAARLRARHPPARQDGAKEDPNRRFRDHGRGIPADRPHPPGDHARRPVRDPLRDQLLLHPVRPEHDHLHLSGGAVPRRGPHHRARDLGGRGKDGRVRRRVPFPPHARLVIGNPRRGDRGRDRLRGRRGPDAGAAA